MTTITSLRESVRGRVTLPGEPGWDDARRAWNLSVDQQPAAVVEAAGVEDVQAVLRAGLRVAPQATGHGAEALGPLDGVVLLKTAALDSIAVDADAALVRVGAGVRAGAAAAAAGEHGLSPVLGLAAGVGVAGLTLGGGVGWLSRTHGLACTNARAFEVVLASGERARVDAQHEPDLFWALRGGGGRGAFVTGLELGAFPASEVCAGMLAWPAERAADVLEQFRRWTWDVPEALSPVFRYLSLPPLEAIPAPLRGRRIVAVIAAHFGTEADGRRLMQPLRGGTLMDTFGPVAPAALPYVAGDPEQPIPARGSAGLLSELSEEAVEAVAGLIADDALAPLSTLELRLLGGALARTPHEPGALAQLDGPFSFFLGGPAPNPEAVAAVAARCDLVRSRLAPWTIERTMLNSSSAGVDAARAFDAPTWERLCAVRDAYDPERRIVAMADAA